MAEQLDHFPGGPTKSNFAWDEWLDGSPWLLRQGEDYEVQTKSLRVSAYRIAKERGQKIRTRTGKEPDGTETIVIQAYKD